MSTEFIQACWRGDDPELAGNRLVILLCLAYHADDDGVCQLDLDCLARQTRITRRNVIKNLRSLEQTGYLVISRCPGQPNTYKVKIPCATPSKIGADIAKRNDMLKDLPDKNDAELAEVCRTYERAFGFTLTPMTSAQLDDLLHSDHYPASWIAEALAIAARTGHRRLSYVAGILRHWRDDGRRTDEGTPAPAEPNIVFDPTQIRAEDVL